MSNIMSEEKQIIYRTIDQPLNVVHTDKEIPIDAKIIYFLRTPISIEMRLNKIGNDKFSANSVKIVKGEEGQRISSIFITTLSTDTSDMRLLITDIDIFSDIGIQDRVVLLDTLGVEYDSRFKKSTNGVVISNDIRDSNLKTSDPVDFTSHNKIALRLVNTLNEECVVQVQGSLNGTDFFDVGDPFTLAASTGADIATITDAYNSIRVTAICSVSPSSGSIDVTHNLKS